LKRFTSPKYAGLLEYGGTYPGAYLLRRSLFMPWELPEVLDPDLVREGWRELQPLARLGETVRGLKGANLRVSALEMVWYMRQQLLRDADWAGMAHSLEIRVPLVDLELLRQVAPLLAMREPPTKLDLARTPEQPLPEEVLNRGRTGFSIPVPQWLAEAEDHSGLSRQRGLRGWARLVYRHHTGGPA
jgi:asparagine synthase (glutamine-hydrolysing)